MTRQSTQTSEDTWPPEEYRRLEARWKSDVDLKLDRLITFADKYDHFLEALIRKEVRWAKFQDAVIEKTLGALIWGALVFVALAAWHYVQAKILGKA